MGKRTRRRGTEGARRRLRFSGFTLVEVMVGVLLLMVAMAGVVPFFLSSLNQAATVRYNSTATNIARERMEQIRQLDYREITDAAGLVGRFGDTETVRDVAYRVAYAVQEATYETGLLKQVTVTVDWTAPPKVSAAAVSTMIHQQYVGPRVSYIQLSPPPLTDGLGSPFPQLQKDVQHTVSVYIAEADWGLVLDGLTWRDFYVRVNLVDEDGTTLQMGDPTQDYKLTEADPSGNVDFVYDLDGSGKATNVRVEYDFNPGAIPDGYWEFQATAFNRYDEPGNVWRLRTRVENGAPAVPTAVAAIPQPDDESVRLYWSGGAERDRDHYEVQRCRWDWTLPTPSWTAWENVDMAVDPKSTSLLDQGDASVPRDPWGNATTTNLYKYQIRAIDTDLPTHNASSWVAVEAGLPGGTMITTTTLTPPTSSSTTTTVVGQRFWVQIENKKNETYNLTIECDNPLMSDIQISVAAKSIVTVENLLAGNYLITATPASTGPDRQETFALDAQKEQIVMIIH